MAIGSGVVSRVVTFATEGPGSNPVICNFIKKYLSVCCTYKEKTKINILYFFKQRIFLKKLPF